MKDDLKPIHPGEILLEELMVPHGLSQRELAKRLNVDTRRINEIVNGHRSISGDTALRLARFFGTTPEFWMNLQARYDLLTAQASTHGAIRNIKPLNDRTAQPTEMVRT